MAFAALALESSQTAYARLMAARRGGAVEETLARILASWMAGEGAMPVWLGMDEREFRRMMQHHFPNLDTCEMLGIGSELDSERGAEMDDLRKLLLASRTTHSQSETWMTDIVIAGCLGSDHLWQDLGLWERSDLTRLMLENFRPLAIRNTQDMKWKKFLYKQLCETEGIYTCRAPSCEVCADYVACFGPEV
ncbi:MAG: nitrogen fixation protein NifQ [Candidatus Thiodiazotropha sp. (ex. Lucinisca nassula)]|nr:nitrogen fixation protein NifQ [Candidatus Thiodiazotropha sp. (ex. Lucinisca nassula)]MBW9272268.1 nitrogen fixation protein NifQ [Candidatus Thiodiazotropha sp. (ex. Lucinisca nassula)]PUB82182.1 MAG: hydrogenase [gamma proteobacterium symbiont of Ctena orbiculata]PUB85203.1 MAG: hydrogenase [gamma proteobacterium symbiont of Ctena orbiculata]